MLEHVAVLVQDVVDDLEEQPELVAEGAPNRQPVFSRCSEGRSDAVPVMSRYWPPIIPSVDWASSRPTAVVGYDSASRNASASSASPARMPTASP